MKLPIIILSLIYSLIIINCTTPEASQNGSSQETSPPKQSKIIKVGAERLDAYLPLINNKNIALVVNQTSTVKNTHLVDTLLAMDIQVKVIFAPEHGFRGKADAGEKVGNSIDSKTGIPLISVYGKNKKPSKKALKEIDLIIFDIQDVGARFYTYISTLHYIMETCAENELPLLVLDRPNPNGHYVDGPILKTSHRSFVGMHPIPIVHGMTIGEYAQMINGEGWLRDGIQCPLQVISCENYTHNSIYELPIKPSPNLPNNRSIYLYPSLCFFEGTEASIGRGTNTQFQVYGHPNSPVGNYKFTPIPREGAKHPKLQDKECRGFDLTKIAIDEIRNNKGINLDYIIGFYKNYPDKENFFLKNLFFDKLAGGKDLREQIIAGKSAEEIKQTWQKGLNEFKQTRKKYLLYNDQIKN